MVLLARVQRVLEHLERGEKAVDIAAFGELFLSLGLFEAWAHDHPDRPPRRFLGDPHMYRHAFGLLAAAKQLAEDQNRDNERIQRVPSDQIHSCQSPRFSEPEPIAAMSGRGGEATSVSDEAPGS
jgi:hypothetical protein